MAKNREARFIALKVATQVLMAAHDDPNAEYGANTEAVKKGLQDLIVELVARKSRLRKAIDKETHE